MFLSMKTVSQQKKELRRELVGLLQSIPAETRQAADEEIRRRVSAMPSFQQAARLFIFVGNGWEVNTWPLIEEALASGKQVAVPRCLPLIKGEAGIMEACLIQSRKDLKQRPPMGLWEPPAGTPQLLFSDIEFVLIPCVACDKDGYRLGQGGGYYDRFLAGSAFTKAALCRQALLQDALPREAHDVKLDYIVTEAGLYSV